MLPSIIKIAGVIVLADYALVQSGENERLSRSSKNVWRKRYHQRRLRDRQPGVEANTWRYGHSVRSIFEEAEVKYEFEATQ